MTKKNLSSLHAEIDANLRKAYQKTLNEKLPKRLTDLIDELRAQESGATESETEQDAER